MHILYLHQYFCPPGGAGNNRSMDLARAWVQAGHRVTMLTSTAYFPASMHFQGRKRDMEVEGVQVVALNIPYSHMMGFQQRIKAFLRFYFQGLKAGRKLAKPDLIYASSTPPTVGEMGRKLARRWGIPFVFETVDVWPDVPIGMGIVKNRMLAKWMTHRVDRIYAEARLIVALSDGMKEQILSHGVPEEKVLISYNGTRLDAFPYVERLPREGLHVIYTGTVGKANDVGQLVWAASMLKHHRDIHDIEVTILGGGNDLEHVKAKAGLLRAENVRFLPMVAKEEVAPLLARAHAGIVTFAGYPVLEANSANKFYDYLASGLPVIINYKGWQAKYLEEWNCGLSSEMTDVEGLADNMKHLRNNPGLCAEMGRNARRLAEAKFDREKIALELLKEFERITPR
jgi:glycosyltransferase involved in cell wall biosynthesis